jgi:hypothetical protein
MTPASRGAARAKEHSHRQILHQQSIRRSDGLVLEEVAVKVIPWRTRSRTPLQTVRTQLRKLGQGVRCLVVSHRCETHVFRLK